MLNTEPNKIRICLLIAQPQIVIPDRCYIWREPRGGIPPFDGHSIQLAKKLPVRVHKLMENMTEATLYVYNIHISYTQCFQH